MAAQAARPRAAAVAAAVPASPVVSYGTRPRRYSAPGLQRTGGKAERRDILSPEWGRRHGGGRARIQTAPCTVNEITHIARVTRAPSTIGRTMGAYNFHEGRRRPLLVPWLAGTRVCCSIHHCQYTPTTHHRLRRRHRSHLDWLRECGDAVGVNERQGRRRHAHAISPLRVIAALPFPTAVPIRYVVRRPLLSGRRRATCGRDVSRWRRWTRACRQRRRLDILHGSHSALTMESGATRRSGSDALEQAGFKIERLTFTTSPRFTGASSARFRTPDRSRRQCPGQRPAGTGEADDLALTPRPARAVALRVIVCRSVRR